MKKKAVKTTAVAVNQLDVYRLSKAQMSVFIDRVGPHGAKHIEREFFNIGIGNIQIYDLDRRIYEIEQEIKRSEAVQTLKQLRAERAEAIVQQENRKQKLHGIVECHFDGIDDQVPLFRKVLMLRSGDQEEEVKS